MKDMNEIFENMPYDIDSCELNDNAKMVFEHVDSRLFLIKCGEPVDSHALFDKAVLASTSELEHRYVFDRTLAYLIAFGEIELEFAGVNDDGQPLYRRLES